MRIFLIFLIPLFLISCRKSREDTADNLCHMEMKERFKSELRCTEKDKIEVNLYSGKYNNTQIYFSKTMCPACNTIPPQFGYSCDGTKISISDFNTKVSDIKEIYNSCTNRFSE